MPSPTAGAAVHYTPPIPLAPMNWIGGQPLPGVITTVHSDQLVAIDVTDLDDVVHQVAGANFLQAGDTPPAAGNYCVLV
jgi:hypothetical protein